MWYYPPEREDVENEVHPVLEWWTNEGVQYVARHVERGWTRTQIEEAIAQLWDNCDEIDIYDDDDIRVVADAVEQYLRESDSSSDHNEDEDN